MLATLNEQIRNSSHVVLRSAVEEIFNQYFTKDLLKQLTPQELNLLSDALTARLTKEVTNEILYRTIRSKKN